MKKIIFLVSLILIVGLSALDTKSKPVDTKQNNVVVESNELEVKPASKECENTLPNGTYTQYNANGTLKSYQVVTDTNKNCQNSLKKGTHMEYFENGRLKSFKIVL